MKKFTPILVLSALSTMVLLQSLSAEFATTKAQARDDWWMERHQQKLQEIATSADEIDLVFIGDSITHFMDDRAPGLVERSFPGMKHLNLGYSADRTENVLWRLQNGEIAGLSPKVVVLMIGTNNTGHRRDPYEVTFGGIRLIVEELRKQLPETKVLLLSIFPRGETAEDPLRRLNESINAQLPRLADGRFVFHLDINEAFFDGAGRLPEAVMPDLLHPNREGYEIWLAAIQPKVRELLAMEALPTPPEIWAAYDPDAGEYREEIVREERRSGIYYRDSYISAYVLGKEIRVFCKYAVKEGAIKAPGLMDVHGWMSRPNISKDYVETGWAVMAHDYCGKAGDRVDYTRYPESLRHGNMDKSVGPPIWSHGPNRESITDYKQTSDYLWYAIQRRVLSYLLSQKEVDAERIGAKGYSYGGTIMWNLAMDERVKAVVAYFGIGWNEYYRSQQVWMYNNPYQAPPMSAGEQLYLSAIAPQAHAPHIRAASLWLNGSNDHHGGHERGAETFKMFQSEVPWDFAIQARGHHNTEKLGDDCKLWLERHVVGRDIFWPKRAQSGLSLNREGIPEFWIRPDAPDKIESLEIHYAQQGAVSFARAWRDAKAQKQGDVWSAELPVLNVDDYVFGFANIHYEGGIVVSSDFEAAIPSGLGDAKATDKLSNQLSEGTGLWSNVAPAEGVGGIKGFRILNQHRGTRNEQFNDPKWKAPQGADLRFKFYCTQPQSVILEVNGQYAQRLEITASDDWQIMQLPASSLIHRHSKLGMTAWSGTQSMAIKPAPGSDITQIIFADFEWSGHSRVEKATESGLIDGKLYLTAEMAEVVDSFWRVMQDKSVSGERIRIAGVEYPRGIGVHADSNLSFNLDGQFSTFCVIPGPDDAHHGQLEMIIRLDDKEVYRSGAMRRGSIKNAERLVLPVAGARKLTLIVEASDGNNGGDHANWAEAYLKR